MIETQYYYMVQIMVSNISRFRYISAISYRVLRHLIRY